MIGRRLLAHKDGLRELAIFAVAYLVYFGVRAITEGAAGDARCRTRSPSSASSSGLGVAWERRRPGRRLGSRLLVDAANAVYMYGHWPVIIVAGVLLFRYRRAALLPAAQRVPAERARRPRRSSRSSRSRRPGSPTCRSSTRSRGDAEGYRQILPPALVNQYAAMPSFHAGWNLLLGIVVFQARRGTGCCARLAVADAGGDGRSRSWRRPTTSSSTSSPGVVIVLVACSCSCDGRRRRRVLDSMACACIRHA